MNLDVLSHILACPRCGAPGLSAAAGAPGKPKGLVCNECREWYEDLGYTPDFFPYWEFYGPRRWFWQCWRATQEAGARVYASHPEQNLSSEDRQDTRDFMKFCMETPVKEDALALDVGTGTLPDGPAYVSRKERMVGIEPLLQEAAPSFITLRGVAEFCPFRDASFDACYMGTSVDHLLFPRRAFQEVSRVLKPGSPVFVWLACVDTHQMLLDDCPWPVPFTTPAEGSAQRIVRGIEERAKARPGLYRFLKKRFLEGFAYYPAELSRAGIPRNQNDPYHMGHYSLASFMEIVESVGFTPVRKRQYRFHESVGFYEFFLELRRP